MPSIATVSPTGMFLTGDWLHPPTTVAVPSGLKRTMFELWAPSSRATSSVTTLNTRRGSVDAATAVATRRSAACSSISRRSSRSRVRASVTSRR